MLLHEGLDRDIADSNIITTSRRICMAVLHLRASLLVQWKIAKYGNRKKILCVVPTLLIPISLQVSRPSNTFIPRHHVYCQHNVGSGATVIMVLKKAT